MKLMIPETVILSILILATALVVGYFYGFNKKMRQQHAEGLLVLENGIGRHRRQILFRSSGLDLYDFQKYNLNDALLPQPEIVFDSNLEAL